jgi:hypothetical protein
MADTILRGGVHRLVPEPGVIGDLFVDLRRAPTSGQVADPRFAQAYARLADAYMLIPGYNVSSPSEAWPRSQAAAEQALAVDSTLAEAHTALAYGSFVFDRDWHAVEQGFRRAIALNPGYATAHHWCGDFLGGRGDVEGFLQELRLAHALDPGAARS